MSLAILVSSAPGLGVPRHVALFAERTGPKIFCDGQIDLQVAPEFFIELANKEPGINEYNVLIGHYRKREWTRLDQGIQTFLADFESTPLREAVAFLKVEAEWERLSPEATEAEKSEAEKMMREVVLLYPRSVLTPAITATFAAYHLRAGHMEKSLSIYSDARDRFPFSELACVFQMGVGETNFHLQNGMQARKSFEQVLQKCQNPRLRIGARIRIAESIQRDAPTAAEKQMSDVMAREGQFVYQFHPEALFNLGELKFGRGDMNGAKHFFDEARRHPNISKECADVAGVRLASVALRQNQPLPDVVGKYLEAHEKAPRTDIGRFAYVRALLLELDKQNPVERARRIKVTDETIEEIGDQAIKKECFLEKGVALLQLGEELALPYLSRFSEISGASIKKENAGDFIRERVGTLLATFPKRMARALTVEDISDRLKPFESAYSIWMKGEPAAAKARSDVKSFILDQISRSPGDAERTTGILNRYAGSSFKEKGTWTAADSGKLQGILLKALLSDKPNETHAVAQGYKASMEAITPWLGSRSGPLQLVIAYQLKDQETLIRAVRKGRGIASLDETSVVLDAKWTPEYQLAVANGLIAAKQYTDAEKLIARVAKGKTPPELMDRVTEVKVELYRQTNRFPLAYDLSMVRYQKAKKEQKKDRLKDSLAIATVGKLWRKSEELLIAARNLKLEDADEASYRFFAGRAYYEAGTFAKAIESYQSALTANPEAPEAPEARYRLGKSFWIRHDKAKAKQAWELLSTLQDPFWSPLAQNELKLLVP